MFFAAEPLLIARLNTIKAPEVKVFSADDLQGVVENSQYAPAYHLVFNNYGAPTEKIGIGGLVEIPQSWTVVVVASHYSTTLTGQSKRAVADALCDTVLNGLLGYKLSTDFKELELESGQEIINGAAYIFMPLTFSTRLIYRGTCIAS